MITVLRSQRRNYRWFTSVFGRNLAWSLLDLNLRNRWLLALATKRRFGFDQSLIFLPPHQSHLSDIIVIEFIYLKNSFLFQIWLNVNCLFSSHLIITLGRNKVATESHLLLLSWCYGWLNIPSILVERLGWLWSRSKSSMRLSQLINRFQNIVIEVNQTKFLWWWAHHFHILSFFSASNPEWLFGCCLMVEQSMRLSLNVLLRMITL